MGKQLSVDIIIPAYNEEKNIASLISQIQKQTLFDSIGKILVISDASTDDTNKIVENLSKEIKKLQLIKKKLRVGKFDSINKGFKQSSADVLVILDADIVFEQSFALEKLIQPLVTNSSIGLTVLKNKPIVKNKTYASVASLFSSYFRDELINSKVNYQYDNFFTLCGRAVAIVKRVYKKIYLADDPGDDQHLFFLVINNGFKTYYVESAVVVYNVPLSIKDYLKQNVRYRKALEIKHKTYGYWFVKGVISKNKPILSFLYAFIKHPISGVAWLPLYSYGKIMAIGNTQKEGVWEISNTTK